jgi:hypothetical protein
MNKYFLITIFLSFFLSFSAASAQSSPEFLISWRSDSYVPDWYSGKILPSAGSGVIVSFELISDGRVVDLSQNAVRWYVNGNLIKNESDGLGIKSASFIASAGEDGKMAVKMTIPDYAADASGDVSIAVANPEAVIDSPYFGNIISAGSSVFRVYPFFFNVKSADYLGANWKINGSVVPSEESDLWTLNLNIGGQASSGSKMTLSAALKNISDIFETANQNIILNIK